MAAGTRGPGSKYIRSLEETPTWALATVCLFFIFISMFIEHLIHLLSNWLKKRKKIALYQSVERLKSVLIVLGFMSLILTVTQKFVTKICVPYKLANRVLPCHQNMSETSKQTDDYCGKKEMAPFISETGLNQLNIFIFVLAVMQIVYSVLTMALGSAKMRRWKAWEKETQTVEYQAENDPNRFRFTRQTTFARRHMSSLANSLILLWIKCFFRQFFNSVAKVDYLTLRQGFIAAHLHNNNSFNFQKYIERSLDDDFKFVVAISPFMWFLVVIFMLVDIHGLHIYLWVSFLPLFIVLAIGTKLEVVVAEMALQLQSHSVIKGALIVQPNDNLFWFSHPKYVLTLIHYTLFVNAFELAFFIWATWQFGINSCFHESVEIIVTRVVLAVIVQVMCSYITLPLYALVTQMGSKFNAAAMEEKMANLIKQWHKEVKEKRKKQDMSVSSQPPFPMSTSSRNIGSPSPDISNHEVGYQDISFRIKTPNFPEITPISEIVSEADAQEIEMETPDTTKTQT